jgi:DNA-binding NtrC family response regulator
MDDESAILDSVWELLETDGHYAFTAGSGGHGLEILQTTTPCLVLSDVNMLGMEGPETFQALIVHAVKMVLSRHMAGCVAHELNNPSSTLEANLHALPSCTTRTC